jgi:hypothetical protein
MADLLYYVIGIGLVAYAALTAWVVLTPGTFLFIG